MGIIKTAILGGVAAYGVHEISKAAHTHHTNQSQSQRSNSRDPYIDSSSDSLPSLRPRDAYNPASQGQSTRAFHDTRSDNGLAAYQEDRGRAADDEQYRVVDSKKQRSVSCGAADEGSSQEYYRARGPYATYQDRPCDGGSAYAGYSLPPPYEQRRQRGFVEEEVADYGPRTQDTGLGGARFMDMLGSQVGKGGLFDLVQGRDGKKGGGEDRRGDGGLGRLGSLLGGMPRR